MSNYTIQQDLSKDEELIARSRLTDYNLPFSGPPNFREIGFALRDDSGELFGALYGSIVWDWLHIHVLWVSDTLRHKGFGSQLLVKGEAAAKEERCKHIKLHTFSFQARPFYESHGYKVIAKTPDFPEGHTQFLMLKPVT